MAAKSLIPEQRAKVIEMLAARDSYAEIAETVGCSIANIDYYAKRYSAQISTAREGYDAKVIDRGLRAWQKRVERLERLANRIGKTLEDTADGGKGLWVEDVKIAGNGDTVDVEVFAGEAIRQYRGLLDDIAKETGGRVTKQEIKNAGSIEVIVTHARSQPNDS